MPASEWSFKGKRCFELSHLHSAHVKAAQEQLEGDDEAEDGAVHVGRRAAVPREHWQEVRLLITRSALFLLPVSTTNNDSYDCLCMPEKIGPQAHRKLHWSTFIAGYVSSCQGFADESKAQRMGLHLLGEV